jgi:hypothetical protein
MMPVAVSVAVGDEEAVKLGLAVREGLALALGVATGV